MIKKLWLKLVLLYTGITGLILALCLGITFFFSCNRYEASLDAQICDQIESYQIKLLSSRQVDQSTLQELEENLDGNIYIFENGTPLFRFEPTGGLLQGKVCRTSFYTTNVLGRYIKLVAQFFLCPSLCCTHCANLCSNRFVKFFLRNVHFSITSK